MLLARNRIDVRAQHIAKRAPFAANINRQRKNASSPSPSSICASRHAVPSPLSPPSYVTLASSVPSFSSAQSFTRLTARLRDASVARRFTKTIPSSTRAAPNVSNVLRLRLRSPVSIRPNETPLKRKKKTNAILNRYRCLPVRRTRIVRASFVAAAASTAVRANVLARSVARSAFIITATVRTAVHALARASRTANHRRNLFSSPGRRRRRRRRNSAAKSNRISPSSGEQRDRGTSLRLRLARGPARPFRLSLPANATANSRGPATRYTDPGRRVVRRLRDGGFERKHGNNPISYFVNSAFDWVQ